MHKIPFDLYVESDSPVHRLPGVVKLMGSLALVLVVAFAPHFNWKFYAVAGGALLFLTYFARVPLKRMLLRVLVLEPFVGGVALLALLQPQGLQVFLGLLIRSAVCLYTMILLAATTPISEILGALRKLHVPVLLLSTLALMSRYLYLFSDELATMQRARASRTFAAKGTRTWYLLSTSIAHLFIRTAFRAEHVYSAMCARGWKS
jgi:cobalt/nickel transport system permease protein